MSRTLLTLIFVALLFAGAFFIISTTAALPDRVASQFGSGGRAQNYMTREGYRVFMFFFAVGFPTLLVFAIAGIPRLIPRYTNIPNRDYWLTPERQVQAFNILTTYSLWFGCLLVLFMCTVHWFVLQANTQHPPQLANGLFFLALGTFLLATLTWTVFLMRRFRIPANA